jgi:hypothetical protein
MTIGGLDSEGDETQPSKFAKTTNHIDLLGRRIQDRSSSQNSTMIGDIENEAPNNALTRLQSRRLRKRCDTCYRP